MTNQINSEEVRLSGLASTVATFGTGAQVLGDNENIVFNQTTQSGETGLIWNQSGTNVGQIVKEQGPGGGMVLTDSDHINLNVVGARGNTTKISADENLVTISGNTLFDSTVQMQNQVMSGSSIRRVDSSGQLTITGGRGSTAASISMTGETNSRPNQIHLYSGSHTALSTDELGRVRTPSQPFISRQNTVNQGVDNRSDHIVIFGTQVTTRSTGIIHNNTNGVFTVPVAGIYQINVELEFTEVVPELQFGIIHATSTGGAGDLTDPYVIYREAQNVVSRTLIVNMAANSTLTARVRFSQPAAPFQVVTLTSNKCRAQIMLLG